MPSVLISLFLLSSVVPTGTGELLREKVEVCPVQLNTPSFSTISTSDSYRTGNGKVLILISEPVANTLSEKVERLADDIAAEGWSVIIQGMYGGTAEDIRALFQATTDLDGAILIGFLPCAWYEEDYWAQEEFPCELFLMDLDGVWEDSDSNGLYDSHTGDVAPEIWLGRIDAHAASFGSELLMLSDYLDKNHLYRTGSMAPPARALTFIDDDWSSYTDCGLNSIYGSSGVTVINSPSQTTADNYLSRLSQGYEFVHLMAHSCPWGHTFKVPSGMAGTVMAPEIAQVNPGTAFLQLFSCSNARWVEAGCLGNWYLFGTDTGLLVSGAAKTGSMLDFEYFYNPVGSGLSFGEAFRNWWEYEAQGGFSSSERAWFYGNALLGDPTLKPVSAASCFSGIEHSAASSGTAVSTSQHSDCFPDADCSNGITAVAWLTGENGRLDVAARFHDENGDSWSQVYIVDADEYWDSGVSVCFDSNTGDPWLAWSDFEYSTYSYRIKTAHGLPFENVTVAAPQDGYQVSPALACTDRMWLAWQDWENTGGRIMLKSLTAGSFSTQLSAADEWATDPAISAGPSGNLHALWVKNTGSGSSVMWSSGNENGFSAPVEISSGTACHSPHIGLVNGELVAVWQEDGITTSIVSRIWNGTSWENEVTIEESSFHLCNPAVTESGAGEPVICWQKGRADAVPMASLFTESSWSSPFQPFESIGPVWNPVLEGGKYFWAGNEGSDWNIYTTTSTGIGDATVNPAGTSLSILRNPVTSILTLKFAGAVSPDAGNVSVYDLSGRTLINRRMSVEENGLLSINCSALPAGVYTVAEESTGESLRFTLLR
ncbi:hypothetical protein CSA37_12840 [Candidatus Fermentibacteria bacterium]|nr:MAG: hypothetical protein CSA37_12840 [Candidatus Fermentibacteria bacterium]